MWSHLGSSNSYEEWGICPSKPAQKVFNEMSKLRHVIVAELRFCGNNPNIRATLMANTLAANMSMAVDAKVDEGVICSFYAEDLSQIFQSWSLVCC